MTPSQDQNPNLHALLIGVDHYDKNLSHDGAYYGSLNGCVRDVRRVERLLEEQYGLGPERIKVLTATNIDEAQPPEALEQRPTYENMVAAFQELLERASPGDQVYIHYSGHGGRVPTRFEEVKGSHAYDETLVPTDIGDHTTRHLRDIELAYLLRQLVDAGLVVTLVLDSCHSGGAARGRSEAAVRGVATIDKTARPTDSLVATDEELLRTWREQSGGNVRSARLASGWLPTPKDYVLLAACRETESAFEYPFDGENNQGALTYWLLDSLAGTEGQTTFKSLHDRIVGKVHGQFKRQTPQLQGPADRTFLGVEAIPSRPAINVLAADGDRVQLNTGQAQGVRAGTRFAIYPAGTPDFANEEIRLALLDLTEVGSTESWGKVVERIGAGTIEAGARAVLIGPAATFRRGVAVVAPIDTAVAGATEALEGLRQELAKDATPFVYYTEEPGEIEFQVTVNSQGEFEIWDTGGEVLGNVRPQLKIGGKGAAARTAQRLDHLARYRNVGTITNYNETSPLANALRVELLKPPAGFQLGDKPEGEPFADEGNTPSLENGELSILRIQNLHQERLDVAVIDLEPNWAVSLTPLEGSTHAVLDGGATKMVPLRFTLPEGYTEGTDTLKVFATKGGADYSWLTLPALDQPIERRVMRGGGPRGGSLEEYFSLVATTKPRTRQAQSPVHPAGEWTHTDIEVAIRRAEPEAREERA